MRGGVWLWTALLLASACGNSGPAAGSPAPAASAPPVGVRTPIQTADSYMGLAVDGQGTAWFAEANSSRLGRYRRGEPVRETALQAGANPRTLRSSPDGSVWFAEPGLGRLARVTPDGKLTERQADAGEFEPNWGVAVGPDGSVWYDVRGSTARLRPDGTVTSYPVQVNGTITVDTHGNAWLPQARVSLSRISDSGTVTSFQFENGIEQLAEGSDGSLWFADVMSGPMPRIGRLDPSGQPRYFDAPNVTQSGFPNEVVRAPDGAVWFETRDARLVRVASETDLTVYSLPWTDVAGGVFEVLAGNRVLMLGRQEILDFVATGGTRLAGAQAFPTPLPHVAKDAAEGAAYAVAVAESGTGAWIDPGQSWEGDHAAEFLYGINNMRAGHALIVYVVEENGAWRRYDSFGTQNQQPPTPGLKETLRFSSGCLNVRESPGQAAKVLACLPSGTAIEIDGLPAYADGTIWWHLVGRGWSAHAFLYCSDYLYSQRPGC